ncbi:conjugative transfer signal peptidase TraF [Novosphingobium resinovorum]|uniref:Conjugative transfer signal peptidase TraF n=1 Tax=Novosphingobium resinovorum TaxID=158500 RepID=A0A1D8AGG1_9SPHN|nr:conjugative transfer signal peptidase TraF [Novosphingobium resinovorum]AOR81207.1 conjugative transfer signal peptidase TraF [Novosphingobium resinovorum]
MRQQKAAAGILAIGTGIVISVFVAGFWGGLRLNLTPSYPLGLWRIEPLDREVAAGDLVFICPPETLAFVLAVKRGYLPKGLCPGGTGPLIKTVVAVAGQDIEIDTAVRIDGAILPSSAVHSVDAAGRSLPACSGGRVPPNSVFLHSPFGGSYDSRYFGPLPDDGILGLANPVAVMAQ